MAEVAESKPANDQQRQADHEDDDDALEQPFKAVAELRETQGRSPVVKNGPGQRSPGLN